MTIFLKVLLVFAAISVLFLAVTTWVIFNRMKKGVINGNKVPSFRITLTERDSVKSAPMPSKAFTHVSQYLGEECTAIYAFQEKPDVLIQGYLCDVGFVALSQFPSVGVSIDIFAQSESGHCFLVSTQERLLDEADFFTAVYLNVPEISEETFNKGVNILRKLTKEHTIISWQIHDFKNVYETTYAKEMDRIIIKGGLTSDEICRMAEVRKKSVPDQDAIELIQHQWKVAVSKHFDTLAAEACPAELSEALSNGELFFVHDYSEPVELAYVFCDALDTIQNTDFDKNLKHYKALFKNTEDLRATFSKVQLQHLPDAERVYQLQSPIPIDIYKEIL